MMIEAGRGHIVNISSLAGKNPLPGGAAYAASKWGLNGLTVSAAEELRDQGIRVSLVCPGSVNTHFGGAGDDPGKAARRLQPDDIADVVATIVIQPAQSFISEVLMRPARKP
jgi:NADP-dependent 3-hydroxy acid dehydrogenase YdfG